MTIQSITTVASSSVLSSYTGQSALPQEAKKETLPEIELITASKTGPEALQNAVREANAILEHVRPDIKFVLDEATKDVVIMLLEPETNNVISRYPTEQALAISNAIAESQARVAEQHTVFQNSNNQLLGLFVEHRT